MDHKRICADVIITGDMSYWEISDDLLTAGLQKPHYISGNNIIGWVENRQDVK